MRSTCCWQRSANYRISKIFLIKELRIYAKISTSYWTRRCQAKKKTKEWLRKSNNTKTTPKESTFWGLKLIAWKPKTNSMIKMQEKSDWNLPMDSPNKKNNSSSAWCSSSWQCSFNPLEIAWTSERWVWIRWDGVFCSQFAIYDRSWL